MSRTFVASAVIPAKAGIQTCLVAPTAAWIPAFAGMTGKDRVPERVR